MGEKMTLLPCPWCGGEMPPEPSVSEGSTFRWRKVDGCCTDGPEVRHDTMADDQEAAEVESRAAAIEAWNTRPGLTQPAQAVESEAFGAMNHALCDFAMRWEIDGDYMRCRKCNRPQITNWMHADFPHAAGCKAAGKVEVRPWETFVQLLAPITANLSEKGRG